MGVAGDRRLWVITVLWTVTAAVGYRRVWNDVLQQWQTNPSYSHGWLVVPVACWLLWVRRASRPPLGRPWLPALGLLLVAHLLLIAGETIYLPGLQRWTLPVWVAGFAGIVCGRALLAWSLPAIGFLCFMIPLPFQAEQLANQGLQSASAWISCVLLSVLGTLAVTDGHALVLESVRVEITTACSGLRMTTALAALGYVLAVASRSGWRMRAALLLLMVPTAVAANALRIGAFAWAAQRYSVSDLADWVHDAGDWIMVPLAAGMLLAGATCLRCYWRNAYTLLQCFARSGGPREGRRMFWPMCRPSAVLLSPLPLALLALSAVQQHGAQQAARCDAILQQAVAAEARGDWRAATDHYEHHLRFVPNDFTVLTRRAVALEQLASARDQRIEALARYTMLLRVSPYDAHLLRRHLELALSLDAGSAALDSATRLRAMGAKDARLRQTIIETQLRFAPAIGGAAPVSGETLETLLADDADGPACGDRCLVAAARYLCRFPRLATAACRQTLDARLPPAVDRLDSAEGYLTRWQYARQFNPAAASDDDLRLALQHNVVGQSTDVFLAAARHARRQHDLDTALRLLELAQQGRAPDVRVLCELGDLYRQGSQPQLAAQAYEQAVRLTRGSDPLLGFKLAETLHELHRDEAAATLVAAVDQQLGQLASMTPAACRLRDDVLLLGARIAIDSGRYDAALAALDRVESSFSAGDDTASEQLARLAARQTRARCLILMERYDEAATLLERMAQTGSDAQELLAAAARAWHAAGNIAQAQACYCRAANTTAALGDAWLEYLGFLVTEGQAAEAAGEVAWRERRRDGDTPADRLRIAEGWELVGRAELAEPHYRAAAQQDPQQIAALSIHLARRGRIDEAVRLIAEQPTALPPVARAHTLAVAGSLARAIDPMTEQTIDTVIRVGLDDAKSDARLLVAVANWYAWRGRTEDARATLDRAVAVDPEDLIAANNRAMLLAEDPQLCPQALAAIDGVVDRAGPASEFLDTRGWILLRMNRPHEAAEVLRRAIQQRSHAEPVAHFHLAAAYLGLGDSQQARVQWDRAQQLRLDPASLNRSERQTLADLQRSLSPSQSKELR